MHSRIILEPFNSWVDSRWRFIKSIGKKKKWRSRTGWQYHCCAIPSCRLPRIRSNAYSQSHLRTHPTPPPHTHTPADFSNTYDAARQLWLLNTLKNTQCISIKHKVQSELLLLVATLQNVITKKNNPHAGTGLCDSHKLLSIKLNPQLTAARLVTSVTNTTLLV